MDVPAVLAVLLMFATTVKADEGNIEFWKEKVTMTCPEVGEWTIDGNTKAQSDTEAGTEGGTRSAKEHTLNYDGKTNGEHYCTYKINENEEKYYFYMKGKVCANCYEVDAIVFGVVLVGDIIGTALIMMIIYKCTKTKSSSGSKTSYKTPSRSGGPAPPTPSRDYETLNVHTRSQDTYSTVNRTG